MRGQVKTLNIKIPLVWSIRKDSGFLLEPKHASGISIGGNNAMEKRETKKRLAVGSNHPNGGNRRGDGDPGCGTSGGPAGRQGEAGEAGARGVGADLRSGFVCDGCGKEMIIAEPHHELEGSDFPICDECWLEDAIRKGGSHE